MNDITTLTEFMENVENMYARYLEDIGEIMSYLLISPSNFRVTSSAELAYNVAPNFSWNSNGSQGNYPNDEFEIVMYSREGRILFESGIITNTHYQMSISNWHNLLSKLGANAYLKVAVKAYSSEVITSGPFYSNFIEIEFPITETEIEIINPIDTIGYDEATFSWKSTNIDSLIHSEYFKVFIYNNLDTIYESSNIYTNSYSLTTEELEYILNLELESVSWQVKWYQETLYTTYIEPSEEQFVNIQTPTIINDSDNLNISLLSNEVIWLKYTAPYHNNIMLKVISNLDISCEVFHEIKVNSNINDRISIIIDNNLNDGLYLEYTCDVLPEQVLYFRIKGNNESIFGDINVQLLNNHQHVYTASYEKSTINFHKSYCLCGDFILDIHQVVTLGNKSNCSLCGQLINTGGSGPIVIRPSKEDEELEEM